MPKTIIILFLLLVFHSANTVYWLSQDGNQYPGCESVFHLQRALEIHAKTAVPQRHYFFSLVRLFGMNWFKEIQPAVVSGISGLFAFGQTLLLTVFHIPFPHIKLLNIFWTALTILSVYLLGKTIGNKRIGLAAALIFSFFPITCGISRKFVPELALIPMVISAYYLLIRTNDFKNYRWVFLLGIVCLLGVIIQPLFIVFLSGAFLYYFFKIIAPKAQKRALRLVNFFICLLIISSSIVFLFDDKNEFIFNLTETFREMRVTLTTRSQNFVGNADNAADALFLFAGPEDSCPCTQKTERGLNLRCFSFYLFQAIDLASPLFFLIFIVILPLCITNKNFRHKTLLLLWLLVPYLLLTLLPRKWGRFYSPALPAMALMIPFGIENLKNAFAKKIIIIFILIAGTAQFFIYSYALPPTKPYLSELHEFINAHRPVPANYRRTAEIIMTNIKKSLPAKSARIVLVDRVKSATRFSHHWCNDLTYYFQILLDFYAPKTAVVILLWDIPYLDDTAESPDYLLALTDQNDPLPAMAENNHYAFVEQFPLQPADIIARVYAKKSSLNTAVKKPL